jgi:cell division protein FtsL
LPQDKIKRSPVRLKREKNFYLRFSLILLVLIFLSIIYIWQRVTLLSLANEIKRLNVDLSNQQREYKYLQVEVASLSSVERIGRLAQQMGFVCPSVEQKKVLAEAPDSLIIERKGLLRNMWTKLERIKRNLLTGGGVEAKEVKHGL